jgi:hypothetical protein
MDQVLAETPPVQNHPKKRHRVNLALAGVLMAQGLSYDEVAPRVGAATGNSLRVNMGKKGLNLATIRNPDAAPAAQAVATIKLVRQTEDALRETLNNRLGDAVGVLGKEKLSYRKLASRGQGHAATLKQLAETWRTLNGNPDQISITFKASALDDSTPLAVCSPAPIDVESSPI